MSKTYSTSNLNLMAFVRVKGLKYIKSIAETNHGKTKVLAMFEDPDEIGSDLELEWYESENKTFQDWRLFFRNEIDKIMREK